MVNGSNVLGEISKCEQKTCRLVVTELDHFELLVQVLHVNGACCAYQLISEILGAAQALNVSNLCQIVRVNRDPPRISMTSSRASRSPATRTFDPFIMTILFYAG
jgi:hypothetical protein